jgi:hypothetical protein
MKAPLTADRLHELLDYDPLTGVFLWKVSRGRIRAGAVAGTINTSGYRQIRMDGRAYLADRLAWLFMTADWPPGLVDHRDRDTDNNRWSNLRVCNHSQNAANSLRKKAGLKGVARRGRRFCAAIKVNGKHLHLGHYDTPEDAHAAYLTAAISHFGEFARAE